MHFKIECYYIHIFAGLCPQISSGCDTGLVAIGTVSGDIMILVCHVTSQDHVIKESCDFIGRSPSR